MSTLCNAKVRRIMLRTGTEGGTKQNPTDRKALKNMRRTSSLLVRKMRRTSATNRKTCDVPVRCPLLHQPENLHR